jgi:hypothetical protein
MQDQRQHSRHDDGDSWFLIDSIWGAFKRHFLFALVLTLPLLAIVAYGLSRWKPEYASSASIVFDVSKVKETQTESSLVLGNRISSTFTSRFGDLEFLTRLTERLEAKGIQFAEYEESKMRSFLKDYIPKDAQPPSWNSGRKLDARAKADQLAKALFVQTFPTQFTMTITGYSSKPEHAQIIAQEAINLYVEDDLTKHKSQLEEQLARLNSLESSTLLEKADPKDLASTQAFVREEGQEASDVDKKALKASEQNYITQILLKQKEAVRAQAIQYEREFGLQAELNALLSKRGAAHPDVIQKRAEIDKFKSDNSVTQSEALVNRMKSELYKLQAEMRAKGIPIDRSVQLDSFSDEVRRFLLDVSNQIRTTELEIENVSAQQLDPSKWVRYNLVRVAEVPTRAANTDKLFLSALVGGTLSLLFFLMIILVREVNYPWIVEAKSLPRRYHLPVLVNVPHARTFLNVDKVRKLRARLADLRGSSEPELKLLDSYRYLQQVLKSKGDPQVICFYDIGTEKISGHAALNLANVMATDSNERIIYLSFNPANQKFLPRGEGGNLMSFLSGEIDWKNCRVKANEEIACDLAVAEHPELQLGHFREDLVQRLLQALREKYQRVIIDGLNPVFVNENTMLGKESDVILVGTSLGASKHEDLERLLSVTPAEKVKGFVLG